MSDTFNMSGDFRGAIINIKSTLRDVTQAVSTLPNAKESSREELTRLVDQLNDLLQKIPPEKVDDAQAVADSAKALIDAANKPKPNKTTLKITADGLKKAAENIAEVMPTVAVIASQIVKAVFKVTD
jgi:methyl-accepting chemotaxis protein